MKQINLNHQQLHSILTNDKFVFIEKLEGVEVYLYQDIYDNECYLQYSDERRGIVCTSEAYNQAEGTLNIDDNFVQLVVIMPESYIKLFVHKLTTESDFSDYISI